MSDQLWKHSTGCGVMDDEPCTCKPDHPEHRPAALDAPIPMPVWFDSCAEPGGDTGRVNEHGVCTSCGATACPHCGHGIQNGICGCPSEKDESGNDRSAVVSSEVAEAIHLVSMLAEAPPCYTLNDRARGLMAALSAYLNTVVGDGSGGEQR